MSQRTVTVEGSDGRPVDARLRRAAARRFAVDPRALAATRVGLGLLLVADLSLRARDLVTFYADAGVLPRSALAHHYPGYSSVSLHALSGEAWMQGALFLVAAVFAVALLAGYRTRLATVASLLLLVSLHARNPTVLNSGDVLLRRLLFWGVFLPLGGRWSVDARRGKRRQEAVVTLASAGLLLQVAVVYASNAAFKLRHDAWLDGTAIRYVFALDQFTVGLGPHLTEFPGLLAVAAWAWLALLCCSVALVGTTGRPRAALTGLFLAGHLGMLATMDLGVFPLVSIVGLLPFLPSSAWDRLSGSGRGVLEALDRRLPTGPRVTSPPAVGRLLWRLRPVLLAALLATMLLSNAFAVGVVDPPSGIPDAVTERSWNMFFNPPRAEGWYVANATLASGRQVTTHVSANEWDRPPDGDHRYPAARWRKYQTRLAGRENRLLHERLAADVCRRWTARVGERIRAVELRFVRERTRLRGPDPRSTTVVGRYPCSDRRGASTVAGPPEGP